MGLPKKTQSLCPDCRAVLDADIFEKDGKVVMQKECKEHGEVTDTIWSDVDLYLKAEKFALDSGSKVGKIRTATQGYFSIVDRDRNSPNIKQVRVVTTVEYYLVD